MKPGTSFRPERISRENRLVALPGRMRSSGVRKMTRLPLACTIGMVRTGWLSLVVKRSVKSRPNGIFHRSVISPETVRV